MHSAAMSRALSASKAAFRRQLGESIAKRRSRLNKGRDFLAASLGLDVSMICRIEQGRVAVSVDRAAEIAELLETSLPKLLPRVSAKD